MAPKEPAKLSRQQLAEVARNAPIASIDLIIENDKGEVLLGLRENAPARGYWFVPGGRILKNERIAQAFERIVREELGIHLPYTQAEFVGVFEHLYPTNFTQSGDFGTHYVVLTHRAKINTIAPKPADEQHSRCQWFTKNALLKNDKVHPHTKAYYQYE